VSDASSQLRAALDKTLEADSLHIELSSEASDTGGGASIDYNAPDRMRTVSEDGTESIIVGDTLYFSDFERPDHFLSSKRAGSASAENLLIFLRVVREAERVEMDGDEFVATLGRDTGTARVLVRDEYVVRLRLQSGSGDERTDATYELSRFGSADEVAAPAPDSVSEAPTTPACPENGEIPEGVFFCSGGNLVEPGEIQLPEPSKPVESTLQFRPVRGDAPDGCSARDGNPDAPAPAMLPDSDGNCLDLEAAGLEVNRVTGLHAIKQGDDISLNLALNDADARRFDQIAEEHLGDRLALVIFGRVVSAPTIHATEFEGQLTISGLTTDEAARVKAALT